MYFLEV